MPSATILCPQQSNFEEATIEPHISIWRHCPFNAQDRNNISSTSYDPTAIGGISIDDDLTPKLLEASCDGDNRPLMKYYGKSCPGYSTLNYSRRTSTATSYRHRNSGITKRQERIFARSIPWRLRPSDVGNVDTHAAISQASTTDSAADSVRSREQDSSSTALSLFSDPNHGIPPCVFHNSTWPTNSDANNETAAQVSANQDSDVYMVNEAPSSELVKHESESGDGAAGYPSSSCEQPCEQPAGLSPSLQPITEFQANLLAAPEDSRYLFLEYYKRAHGDPVVKAESQSEVYWKWDKDRQQWFHKDPNTQAVMWFLG